MSVSPTAERIKAVEEHSASFRKELGLRDLVLTQIMYVVGTGWVGVAAKLGTGHLAYWLSAIALFYLPQAAVVIYLNRLMPLEGGIYQWATIGLGEFWGFLTAWNLWAYTILILATFGVIIATNLSYLLGSLGQQLISTVWYTPVVSVTALVAVTVISVFGLRVAKWVQNAGGIAQFVTFGALILVPLIALRRGTISSFHPLAVSIPAFTLLNLNLFGKMALGAFSGFEYVAILAGETKSPAKNIGRSVLIATPIIALMFILGTSSVVALVPRDRIDLASPIPQALSIGFQGLGIVSMIAPVLVVSVLMRQVANMTLTFAGNTRLPMVAGWDGILPGWFTRLHRRHRTPVNSILFVGVLTMMLTLLGQSGVGVQEAYQLLDNAAGIFYGFIYIAMFAIPLAAASRLSEKPPLWLRAAAVAGLGTSILFCVLSIFPIIAVQSWQVFTLKIVSVLVITNVIGLAIYIGKGRITRAR